MINVQNSLYTNKKQNCNYIQAIQIGYPTGATPKYSTFILKNTFTCIYH